jgi:hypothetical protein
MKTSSNRARLAAVACAAAGFGVAGCGSQFGIATSDGGVDSGTGTDAATDVTMIHDTGADAPGGDSSDATSDVAPGIETSIDAASDATTDATTDAGTDAATDAASDGTTDAATEVTIVGETGSDAIGDGTVVGETGGDASSDVASAETPGDSGVSYTPIVPPPIPTVPSTGSEMWFVVNAMQLGVSDRGTGTLDTNAWKTYGFDLDGRDTSLADSKANTDSCAKVAGAGSTVLVDGNGGIDNNFGSQVMTVIRSLKSDVEATNNATITSGQSTMLLRLQNVGATFADGTGVSGALYSASFWPTGGGTPTPTFTTSDHWSVVTSSLVNSASIGDPSNAVVTFPNGYISGGYWVSGRLAAGTVDVAIGISGTPFVLPLQSGVLTVKLSDGSDGTIAGAVSTAALQTAVTPVAESFGICPGNSTFDSVVTTLTEGADLVSGAPELQDTTVTCDAMSVGLGFTLAPTGVPTATVAPPTPPKSSCP